MYSDEQMGKTLRFLRENKGYSLEYLCQNDMTRSFLSKVERGQSRISADKFILLLQRLEVGLNEFLQVLRQGELSKDHIMMGKLQPLVDDKTEYNLVELEALFASAEEENVSLQVRVTIFAFLCAAKKVPLPKEYEEEISNKLFTVEEWGDAEFELFNMAAIALDFDVLITYARMMIKKKDHFKKYEYKSTLYIATLLNILDNCIRHKEYTLAEYFIKEFEDFGPNRWHGSHRLCVKFLQSLIDYHRDKSPENLEKCRKYIEVADLLDLDYFANGFEEMLETM